MINNHIRLSLDSRVRFSRDVNRGYALRSMDSQNPLISHSRTDLFKFSLPLDIREASSVADFKMKVTTFLTL